MKKLKELKQDIADLEEKIKNVKSLDEGREMINTIWPPMKDVIELLISMKITRKKVDAKLTKVVDEGDKIYTITSSDANWDNQTDQLIHVMETMDDYIDKIIATLMVIDKFFREESKMDDLLESSVDILAKVKEAMSKVIDEIEASQ